MYRVTKAGNIFYAVKCRLSSNEHVDDIKTLTDEGEPVILIDDLEDLHVLGIHLDNIKVV